MKKLFAAAVATILMASCATNGNQLIGGKLGGEWNVVSIDGKAIDASKADTPPYMGFDVTSNNVYGNAGCNMLTGALKFSENNGTIDLSAMGCTRMMCANMSVEDAMLTALSHARKYAVKGDTLTLKNASGKDIMMLMRK